jgi:DUF4097 and DUF4098 domain-containing protein YvlB
MDEHKMEILKMVQEGKITAEEGMELLKAIEPKGIAVDSDGERVIEFMPEDYERSEEAKEEFEAKAGDKKRPRFLIIQVSEGDKKKVNVKIPLKLARMASRFIPKSAQAHMKAEGIELDLKEIIAGIEELGANEDLVNVIDEEKGETVRIFTI